MAVAFGGREMCNADYDLIRRQFGYLGLEYVAEGTGLLSLDGASHRLEPGSVFTYRQDTHIEIRSDAQRPMLKYFVCLGGDEAATNLAAIGLDPPRVRTLATHAEVRAIFDQLLGESQRQGPLVREIGATLFRLLLLKLRVAVLHGAYHRRRSRAYETFLRCRAVVDAQVTRQRTLRDIAQEAGVEVSNICRLFRRYQGASPHQYLLRRKISLAAAQLAEHGGLIKKVALDFGFTDPYHFSRRFKAIYGVTPRKLLRYQQSRSAGDIGKSLQGAGRREREASADLKIVKMDKVGN